MQDRRKQNNSITIDMSLLLTACLLVFSCVFFNAISELSMASMVIPLISRARLIDRQPDPVPISRIVENFFF